VTTADPVIAVVDDEASVRTMLGRVLRLADYAVAAFSSGDDFLASLARQVPACVILDVHMPLLSGLDVHSQLRAVHPDVPVIYITANDDPALDKIVLDAQGLQLLRKPFPSERLVSAVAAALKSAS